MRGYVGRLADFGLDEDVSLHHEVSSRALRDRCPLLVHATVEVQTCNTFGPLWRRRSSLATTRETLAGLGEFGLIASLPAWLPSGPRTLVGIGDDAAVLATPDGRVVATTDFLLEGRHFRRDWSSACDVGHKAAARSLADVAAMGAVPSALLVALAAPADLPVSWARGPGGRARGRVRARPGRERHRRRHRPRRFGAAGRDRPR